MTDFLFDGPQGAPTLVLAHGSGAGMDTEFMTSMAGLIGERGMRVARFEFEFMAVKRVTGKKRPPPRGDKLIEPYLAVLEEIDAPAIFIGGKSLGARVASMMAQQCFEDKKIAGLVCLGYPFHPPGKPECLRTAHFENYDCPSLICQGERDLFGKREEIEALCLPDSFKFHWAPFGNHDLTPPKRSGATKEQNWSDVADAVVLFMENQAL